MITHHTQLLNALIEKYGYKSYLEIGVQNPANNFDKVRCERKVGVDPCLKSDWSDPKRELWSHTSDDWFNLNKLQIFDLIFIDGLHHAAQVKRDFENSLRCLSPNGRIVIHDVLPENEAGTIVPRQTKQWWGDVYKWAMTIKEYDDIEYITYNIDNGCMVIKKSAGIKGRMAALPMTWDIYQSFGRKLMNVTDEVDI